MLRLFPEKWFLRNHFPNFSMSKRRRHHSFKTRPDHRLGQVIGSRVRWVDPGQQKKTPIKKTHN